MNTKTQLTQRRAVWCEPHHFAGSAETPPADYIRDDAGNIRMFATLDDAMRYVEDYYLTPGELADVLGDVPARMIAYVEAEKLAAKVERERIAAERERTMNRA